MQKQFQKPFPMGRISYPTSGAELETWVEQTIQRPIFRGGMLQDQKSLVSERSNNTAIFIKPPRLAGESVNRRSYIPRRKGNRGRSKSPLAKNARMSTSESRALREESSSSYKSSRFGRPACSMRISELAAPTKRQCIAAWRANAKVLPAPMVDRLKQRVMDQEPIVKVSDVVNCIKNKKLSSNTRNNVEITPIKRPSTKINKEAMKSRIQEEYKVISDVFGMRIAQLLMKPVAITLNPQLQNLSNVIGEEIKNVVKDTKVYKTDKATNMRMVQEISEKVTIWIAKILQDASEKLLEEDLKARAIPAGELVTLIQIITYLEEQEGPVLDILDDMMDTVLHKCVKTPSGNLSTDYLSVSSGDVNKDGPLDTEQLVAHDEASEGDGTTVDEKANKDTIVNDIMKQLNKVIDFIEHEDISKTSIKKTTDQRTYQQNNEEKYDESEFGPKPNIKPEPDVKAKSDINPEPDIKTESDIDFGPDIKAESDINLEPDIEAESDTKHEPDIKAVSDINPEPDSKDESDKKSESYIKADANISPEANSKTESDMKPEPDIDVLYSNDNPLVIPGEYNDDENNTNEGISDTPDFNSMLLPAAEEVIALSIMQNLDKGDDNLEDNVFLEPEENNVTHTNEEQTSNVSGAIELITGQLSEEKSKKVQFSNENLDPMKQYEYINPFIREILQFEDEHLIENVADFEKLHIDFAQPNDELLSDADESWPEKVPVTKPSASVTRSISSMGRLLESDEIDSIAFEDGTENPPQITNFKKNYDESDGEKDLHNTLNSDVIENLKKMVDDMQNNTQDLPHLIEIDEKGLHEPLTETENLTEISFLELALVPSVMPLRKDESVILIKEEELQDPQYIKEPEPAITQFISMEEKDIPKCRAKSATHIDEGTTKCQIDKGRCSAEEFTSQKFDFRVHPKTAPAWIRRGQGEPNGGPYACRPFHYTSTNKMKQRELEIQKWCRDLDFILMNLNKWKNWLNYISKYITDLKRRAGKIRGSREVRSPPNTSEDTTWRTLNKRAKGGLEMRRQDETIKFKRQRRIYPHRRFTANDGYIRNETRPVKYCVNCGRTKPNQLKRWHHRSHSKNNTESLCKRHHKREV